MQDTLLLQIICSQATYSYTDYFGNGLFMSILLHAMEPFKDGRKPHETKKLLIQNMVQGSRLVSCSSWTSHI